MEDPEARELVESMKIAVQINANQLGASYSEDILEIFDNVTNRVDKMIEKLEAEEGWLAPLPVLWCLGDRESQSKPQLTK